MASYGDVVCIGEALIDFICTDMNVDLESGQHFVREAGGAPANVAVAVSKLGTRAAFVGKAGKDPFGQFLKNTLKSFRVDTTMFISDERIPTTMAFVSLKSNGERNFTFNQGADRYLKTEELDQQKLFSARIIHFGSATALLSGPVKETYLNVLTEASTRGIFTSFDPNFRPFLWENRIDEFIDQSRKCIAFAKFVKVSEEELHLISGKQDLKEAVAILHRLGAKIIAVTLGHRGTFISNGEKMDIVKSIKINAVDSTGAGDAFVGAILHQVANLDSKKDLENFAVLKKITAFANRVGAITCTKIGAMSALPDQTEVTLVETSD